MRVHRCAEDQASRGSASQNVREQQAVDTIPRNKTAPPPDLLPPQLLLPTLLPLSRSRSLAHARALARVHTSESSWLSSSEVKWWVT